MVRELKKMLWQAAACEKVMQGGKWVTQTRLMQMCGKEECSGHETAGETRQMQRMRILWWGDVVARTRVTWSPTGAAPRRCLSAIAVPRPPVPVASHRPRLGSSPWERQRRTPS
eukprot:gene24646-biopygen23912